MRLSLLIALVAMAALGRAEAQDTALAAVGRNVGVLRSADVLKIIVFRDKELSGDYMIDAQGFVQMPGLGDLQVAGLSPVQIKERIKQQLVKKGFNDPDVSVLPLIRVAALGEVRSPGPYSVEPGANLLQLLTIAGGPGDRANLRHVRVLRDGKAFFVDLEAALAGSASGRVVLYSNDVLYVPRRSGAFTRENLSFGLSLVGVVLTIVNLAVTTRR
ncbi:MAG: polysaccharide biosynthesis/export family protein [Gemmatimonadota bacterium]|nr:polysaccharide biosynthesis/export family protein [Gemmatimonadota bacterium]